VLLEVMAFATDVAGNFETVGQTHACNLAKSGIGLLRCGRVDTCAYAALLRATFQCRDIALVGLVLSWIAYELVDRRHNFPGQYPWF